MDKLSGYEKYLYLVSSLMIVLSGALGFVLIYTKPQIESLMASGHSHLIGFAMAAILFGYLLRFISLSTGEKWIMAVWTSLTFVGPLTLIYAGYSGTTSMLKMSGIIFEGSFVLMWLVMIFALAKAKTAVK